MYICLSPGVVLLRGLQSVIRGLQRDKQRVMIGVIDNIVNVTDLRIPSLETRVTAGIVRILSARRDLLRYPRCDTAGKTDACRFPRLLRVWVARLVNQISSRFGDSFLDRVALVLEIAADSDVINRASNL